MYPHTTKTHLNFLAPDNLKGADMLMYEIFRSLGLKVSFRPVVKKLLYYDEIGDARPVIGPDLEWTEWGCIEEYEETYDWWTGKVTDSAEYDETKPRPEYMSFDAMHWLNDTGHEEMQISWIAVSSMAHPLPLNSQTQESADTHLCSTGINPTL